MDNYHNLQYPFEAQVVSDWNTKNFLFDDKGDSVFTNYSQILRKFRSRGYYLIENNTPLDCVHLLDYGALLIIDPERAFQINEIKYIQKLVFYNNYRVIFLVDWFDLWIFANRKLQTSNENLIPNNIFHINQILKGF